VEYPYPADLAHAADDAGWSCGKAAALTQPDIGIGDADMSEDDWISLQQIRDFIEAQP
jgi:hypothetical protein